MDMMDDTHMMEFKIVYYFSAIDIIVNSIHVCCTGCLKIRTWKPLSDVKIKQVTETGPPTVELV